MFEHVRSVTPSGVACRAIVAALAFAAAAPAALAQTIVPNPYLHNDLAPWSAFTSTAPDPIGSGAAPVWQPSPDVNSSAASGSARITLAPSAPGAASGIAQCVDFGMPTAVSFYNVDMAFHVADAAVLDGSTSIDVEVRLFADTGCMGFLSGGTQGQALSAPSVPIATWYRIADNHFVPQGAPLTAASAQVRAYLRQTGTAPTQAQYTVALDQFVLVLNSTTPVELLHFNID
ncbi:hypothetical protein ACQQ2N_04210 [Dokdonella sp. MW10]|uniref:hypothetical protein n=1 Tax=Dokdonella sp. MW10 TaxID=2992926 RepID=UPI003F7FB06C